MQKNGTVRKPLGIKSNTIKL